MRTTTRSCRLPRRRCWRLFFGYPATVRQYAVGVLLQRVWLMADRSMCLSCMAAGVLLPIFVWYNVLQLQLRLHHNVLRYVFPTPVNVAADGLEQQLALAARLSSIQIVLVILRNAAILAFTAMLVLEPACGLHNTSWVGVGGRWL